MRFVPLLLVLLAAGCAVAPGPTPPAPARAAPDGLPSPRQAVQNFITVVRRVEPVAEAACRSNAPRLNCDFQILVDDDPRQPPNAFQTIDRRGRPVVVFTIGLIAEARNQDELAFILGHEAAHHIEGHIPRQQESALRGAVLFGVLTGLGGGDEAAIRAAQDIGATVGARTYSKDFELEADRLGTVIAHRAGYDPVRGAAYFFRVQDPGNVFLGTHPPNAARVDIVRRTAATLR